LRKGVAKLSIDINRLQELARIALDASEAASMEKDFTSIIALVDTLRDADIPHNTESDELENAISISDLREDIVQKSLPVSILVGQSPTEGEFSIPKVVDSGGGA
jgi:aspartyl/glutamyl-tRNA(Asn/Gln) amidotransferase C subunit